MSGSPGCLLCFSVCFLRAQHGKYTPLVLNYPGWPGGAFLHPLFESHFALNWTPKITRNYKKRLQRIPMEATAQKVMQIVPLGTLSTCPNCMRGLRNRCFQICRETSEMDLKKHLFGRVAGSKTLKIRVLRQYLKTHEQTSAKTTHFGLPFPRKTRNKSGLGRLGTPEGLPSLAKAPPGRIWHHFEPNWEAFWHNRGSTLQGTYRGIYQDF